MRVFMDMRSAFQGSQVVHESAEEDTRNEFQTEEKKMLRQYIHALRGFATLRAAAGGGGAQDCSGTITVEEALKAEQDRYAAQMKGDVGAMQRLIGDDLVYIHSSTVQDTRRASSRSIRSGNVKYAR